VDAAEARRRFTEARVARLGTVRGSGEPHLVPFVFALQGDRIYSVVDEKPKRTKSLQRLANIAAHPRVTALVDEYEESWDRLWWVRVDGHARVVNEGPERDRAVELLAAKYRQYRDVPPAGPAIVVDIDRWRCWPSDR
jgi:PPOX class probable F420-dependent enzyme